MGLKFICLWNGEPTLSTEQFLLGGSLVVDGIEGEGELLGFVLWVRNFDNVRLLRAFFGVGANNNIALEFIVEERPYSCNDPDRHDDVCRDNAPMLWTLEKQQKRGKRQYRRKETDKAKQNCHLAGS